MIELKLTFKTVEEYFRFLQTMPNTHTVKLFTMPGVSEQIYQLYVKNKEVANKIRDEFKAIQDLRDQAEKEKAL